MNWGRRELGVAMRRIGAGVMAMCAATAYAGDKRDCTSEEERAGDQRLRAIAKDQNRSNELIELHLPFGAHVGTHASQGRTNEREATGSGRLRDAA